jgi:IclR family mhp operon transcriptional activator
MEKGVPIRAISRSLAVLRAVNRAGSLSMMEIAQSSRVPYPTACRIVQTLLHEGVLEREPMRKKYRPTALVQSLSHGFQDHSGLIDIARPHLVEITQTHLWPVSLVTRIGQAMIVRDCTHAISPVALNNYYPGALFPLLESAAGQVYLAYADDDERGRLLNAAPTAEFAIDPLTLKQFETGGLVEEIRRNGFAWRGRNRFTNTPGRTSSLAAPIFKDGQIYGALTLVLFATAMRISEAVERYAPDLIAAANRISTDFAVHEHPEAHAA